MSRLPSAAVDDGNAVHQHDIIRVGDLVLAVASPSERTTLEIVVERDGSLVAKAPRSATVEQVERFVTKKRPWIYRKLAEKDALVGPPVIKQFVDGEGFAYLGRSHRLLIDDDATGVRLERGRFHIPPATGDRGAALMRDWYVNTGGHWLRRRVRPWAARMGLNSIKVQVRDLGYRWGSARPTDGPARINIHWSTLQLPPSLIDYVLVHELAHLREANHTPEFWAIVARLMPSYEAPKTTLAAVGRNVWLGRTAAEGPDGPISRPGRRSMA